MSGTTGTTGNDNLNGGSGADIIDGGAGNDKISGGSGSDILDGGSGSDTVNGDSGNDTLIYNLTENLNGAKDIYTGGSGIDTVLLELTQAEWIDPAVRAELQRYVTFLATVKMNTQGEVSNGSASDFVFSFGSSGTTLTVQMMEKLAVSVFNPSTGNYDPVNFHQTVLTAVTQQTVVEAANAAAQDLLLTGTLSFIDLDVGQVLGASVSGAPAVAASAGVSLPAGLAAALAPVLSFGAPVPWVGGTQTIGYTYDPAAVNLDFLRAGLILEFLVVVCILWGVLDTC